MFNRALGVATCYVGGFEVPEHGHHHKLRVFNKKRGAYAQFTLKKKKSLLPFLLLFKSSVLINLGLQHHANAERGERAGFVQPDAEASISTLNQIIKPQTVLITACTAVMKKKNEVLTQPFSVLSAVGRGLDGVPAGSRLDRPGVPEILVGSVLVSSPALLQVPLHCC